jgi:hypothetical protein
MSTMTNFNSARNMNELAALVHELDKQFRLKQEAGQVNVQDVQTMVGTLTRLQLLLNEFERVEVRGHGVSREAAERFATLEGRIRSLRGELFDELRRSASPLARGA